MTLATMVSSWLMAGGEAAATADMKQVERPFVPSKELSAADFVLIDMLNSAGHEDVCYCVCDPAVTDSPIIFASSGFCDFTGYTSPEIEGRNCRFLQGKETAAEDIARIRKALEGYAQGASSEPISVNLLNYRKDGTSFCNEFFLAPLRDSSKKLQYLIGVQCPVSHLGPGQAPSNAG